MSNEVPDKLNELRLVPAATAIDPVCGMTVDPNRAAGTVELAGRSFYFCSTHCVQKFRAEPQRYLEPKLVQIGLPGTTSSAHDEHAGCCGAAATTAAAAGKVEYICPMDPEVLSDRPGPCPKCGMALEPRVVALEEGPNPELVDMSR